MLGGVVVVVPSPGSSLRSVADLHEHTSAGLVPAMEAKAYEALRADIDKRGVQVPLEITPTGVVLDGRQRLQAAGELGIRELAVWVIKPEDEVAHILLAALNRRHLNQSQKAALAIELDEYRCAKDAAQKRRRRNLRDPLVVATLPPRPERSRETAAKLAGVSARTVQDVVTVRAHDPELYEQVKLGALPAHRAANASAKHNATPRSEPQYRSPEAASSLSTPTRPGSSATPTVTTRPSSTTRPCPSTKSNSCRCPPQADALLYLWAVNSHLPQALEVLAAWGFEYRSCEAWVKPSIGMGVWTRNRHELLRRSCSRGPATSPRYRAGMTPVSSATSPWS